LQPCATYKNKNKVFSMNDATRFLTKPENLSAIINSMPAEKLERYREEIHHRRSISGFDGRKLIMCSSDEQGLFEVDRFVCSDITIRDGHASITVKSRRTGETFHISYEPVELYDYGVWLSLAPQMTLTWSAGVDADGATHRTFLYGLMAHTSSSSWRMSLGDVVVLTPKEFEELKVAI
jgi:hypothetical protein